MYTRYQIEWVFGKLTGLESKEAVVRLNSRIKRLLQDDRALHVEKGKAKTPIRRSYAFFGDDGPGTGQLVTYSKHDIYILYLAYLTLTFGWKPSYIVPTFRIFREALCDEYDRLNNPKYKVCWRDGENERQRLAWLESGKAIEDVNSLSWLILTNSLTGGLTYSRNQYEKHAPGDVANVVRSSGKLAGVISYLNRTDGPTIVIEICNPALSIEHLLINPPQQSRGRPSSK